MTIELTLTVTQMVNNWKEMNESTVTVTQKIWIIVTNCNSKDLQLSYSFLIFLFHNCNFNSNSKENCIVTQSYWRKPWFKHWSVTSSNIDAQRPNVKKLQKWYKLQRILSYLQEWSTVVLLIVQARRKKRGSMFC